MSATMLADLRRQARDGLRWIAWLNVAIAAIYVVILARLMLDGLTNGADFTAFDTAWQIVLRGRGASLFDPAVQAQVQQSLLGGQTFAAGLAPFVNPPYSVLPFLPLGLLPLNAGYVVWLAVQVALLGFLVRMVLRVAGDWTPTERFAAVGWIVAFPALAVGFFEGSFSLLTAVGVLAAFEALRSGRDLRAGLWLVVAAVKPQVILGPALALVAGRRWRAVVAAGVAMAILAIAATIAFGLATWTSYATLLGTYTSTFDQLSVEPSVMWNLRGTAALILGPSAAPLVNLLGYVGLAVGLVLTWFVWRGSARDALEGTSRALALRFAVTIVLTLLLSPHVNPHDDILAVVAAILGYGALRGERLGNVLAVGSSVAPLLILVTNGLSADGATTLVIRVPTLLLIGLLGILVAALVADRRAARIRTRPFPTIEPSRVTQFPFPGS
jgi:hypothetical protein